MARHAEVTAEDIITAGIEIEKAGRLVNPGSIRNKLGSGGFPRIKNVWEEHKKQVGIIEIDEPAIELPTEIADNLEALSKQMQAQLTKITKSSYGVAMHLAEKRVASTISDYKEKITELEQFEADANDTVQQCEKEHDELEIENENIRLKMESLSIDNATLIAQLANAKEVIIKLESKEKELNSIQQQYAKLEGKFESLNKSYTDILQTIS
jgi:chromosome segregation ATPase